MVVGRQASRPSQAPVGRPRRRRRGGWRRSRPGRRCGSSVAGCARITSRRKPPSTRVASRGRRAGRGHVDGVVAEVGQRAGRAAAGRRWRAGWRSCAARPSGASAASSATQRARRRRRAPRAGSCAATPRAARGAPGCRATLGERHLVRAPGALDRQAVDRPSGPVQPLGVRSTIIGQRGRSRVAARGARVAGSRAISSSTASSVAGHAPGASASGRRRRRSAARSRSRASSVAQLVARDAGEHGRVGDLVAVEVQDRQHRAVACRVEELVRVPARGQRPGLGLAVADDAGDEQVGVVERGAVGVRRARSRARRPRGSSRASPARRGWGCRRGTRTAGTAAACPPRPARRPGRPRCRCPRGRCWRRAPGPPWPGPVM